MFGGHAYASSTAGAIKGLVIDDGGGALPGAVVTLSSPVLIGGAQQRKTDDDGRFIFVELPPGSYQMVFAREGFGTVTRKNIAVGLGRTVDLTVEMKYGGAQVDVVDTGPVIDQDSTTSGQNFNSDFLSRVPSGRTYQDVVNNTPGVVDNGSGNPNSGGASYNENSFMLDGVNITDPVTGTFSMNFNFDSIDEVQVVTTGFDPEYNALGATISVVTKSGGNSMEVVTNAFYTNGNWSPQYDAQYAADGSTLSPTGFDRERQYGSVGFQISGPVVKDRVWFLGSYEYNRTLIASAGVPLPRDFDSHYFYGKLTAQPVSSHRFAWSFGADPTTIDNITQSRYFLPEAQDRQAQGGFFTTLKWNWFPDPEVNTEVIAFAQKTYIEQAGVPCTHDKDLGYSPCDPTEAENNVDFDTPARWGDGGAYYARNAGSYYLDDRWNAGLKGKVSFLQLSLAGKHDVKVGFETNFTRQEQVQGYSGNLAFMDAYTVPYDPTSLQSVYWYELTGPYVYTTNGLHVVGFAADSYKPIENLTIFGGLRYDMSNIRNDVGYPVLSEAVFGPRVSISWDPFADQKTRIFGGYGRFNDVGRLGISSVVGVAGLGSKLLLGPLYGGGDTSTNVYYSDNDDNTNQLGDNLIAPREDAFVLGAEREVAPNTKVKVEFTAKFTRGVYSFDETNLIFDEDGYNYIGANNGVLQSVYRMRTPLASRRDYYQTDLQFLRNFADRWLAQATYSYVVSKGTVQDGLAYGLSNPSQIDLMYGNLPTDIRHQVKLAVAWDIPNDPWTTQLSLQGSLYSGSPLSRYYYAPGGATYDVSSDGYGILHEPLGTYARTEPTYTIGARVAQAVPVKKGELKAFLEVENLTNATMAYGVYQEYVNYQNRYIVYGRQYPINGTLGVQYAF